MRILWKSVVIRFVPVACFLLLSFALFVWLAVLMSSTVSATTADPAARAADPADPAARAAEAAEPSSAIVRKLDGTEVTLAAPLSIQGDLEATCGWRFLALDVTRIRQIRRAEDGRYVLAGDEGELTVQPGLSAVFGKGEWGYERIPLAETESIVFEGGSPGAPPQAAFYWTVTDECGQETRLACPEDVEWTTATCLPATAPAQYGPFQLKVYPTHIVAATRGEDAGGMYLRLADGTELDGATFAGDVLLTGQTQFGHLAIPLVQVQCPPRRTRLPCCGCAGTRGKFSMSPANARRSVLRTMAAIPCTAVSGSSGLRSIWRSCSPYAQPATASPSRCSMPTAPLANLTLDPDQELAAGQPPLEVSLAISDLLGIRALDPPPPEPAIKPAWVVTDTRRCAALRFLAYDDGVLDGADAVAIGHSSLASVRCFRSPEWADADHAVSAGVIEVVSGTLSGEIAPGQSFTIPVSSVIRGSAPRRRAARTGDAHRRHPLAGRAGVAR